MEKYLEVGQIVNTFGIKGQVKVVPFTDDIRRFDELKQIQDMSSTKIIEDWTPHTMTFTYEDVTYRGVFRARELEQIKRGNITNSILEKARVIKRWNK